MNAVEIITLFHWIAVGLAFLMLIYTILQKPSEMQKHAIALGVSAILFLLGYIGRIDAQTEEGALFGVSLTYMGEPFVLFSMLMMFCTFFGFKVKKPLYIITAVVSSSVPVIVYLNPIHHLFYATVEFDHSLPFSPLVITRGPLYYFNMVISAAYFVAMIYVVFRGYSLSKSKTKRRLTIYCLLMLLSGGLGYLFYFLKLTNGYDTTMLGFSLGVFFLAILFIRCRVFNIVDKAKDYALDISTEGLVVLDDSNRIVYQNDYASILMKKQVPLSVLLASKPGTQLYQVKEKTFNIQINEIRYQNDYLGKSIEIHDITDVHNHQQSLEKAVLDTTNHLENIQRTLLGSMASIVEARSLETGDHIKRVSDYTEMIAKGLQLNPRYKDIVTDEFVKRITLSSPLHDIGKIAIQDAILLKPGRLTDEEFEIMKQHAEKGAEIIEKTMTGLESEEYVFISAEIAKYHHEKWNGTGYPCGLKGEEIPLSARIVALADSYDAMTSKRCYKDAFPNEKAISIIKEESGQHFDPDVVAAFLSNI